MNEVIETFEFSHGIKAEIVPDMDPMDPRDADMLAVLYCWHPDYELGDEQFTRDDHDSMEDVVSFLVNERHAVTIFPLFLLDHSGISIRTGAKIELPVPAPEDIASKGRFIGDEAGWDTTHVGYAYVTIERADELGAPHDSLDRQLEAEVDEYDHYIRGEAYGYVTKMPDGEVYDSCWGYFEEKDCADMAKASGKDAVEAYEQECSERAHWASRDVVTIATGGDSQ